MWRITAEGRRFLRLLAAHCGGRAPFAVQVGIGKNQIKPLLDTPDHSINHNTLRKLRDFSGQIVEGTHYEALGEDADRVSLRIARDRVPAKTLNRHDQRGIERLYEALYKNPQFKELRPALDSPTDFHQWFDVWSGASEDHASEQFFVYRIFRDKVISFLFGERHLKSTTNSVELFAIWYLVGVSNAFYDDSPVGLDADDEKLLPLGERKAAVEMTKRLLEELREEKSVRYLIFEVEVEDLRRPNSYGRMLFRVYSHAEEDIRQHFASDRLLCDARFYVLDFPYYVPREGKPSHEFTYVEHRLVCCPLQPPLRIPFQQRSVPAPTIQTLLTSIYGMYWDYYDADSPEYHAIRAATRQAEAQFQKEWVAAGRNVPCDTLREYINRGFGRKG